jgi:hypothetical protein
LPLPRQVATRKRALESAKTPSAIFPPYRHNSI